MLVDGLRKTVVFESKERTVQHIICLLINKQERETND